MTGKVSRRGSLRKGLTTGAPWDHDLKHLFPAVTLDELSDSDPDQVSGFQSLGLADGSQFLQVRWIHENTCASHVCLPSLLMESKV
jgi:hypothetical protein